MMFRYWNTVKTLKISNDKYVTMLVRAKPTRETPANHAVQIIWLK